MLLHQVQRVRIAGQEKRLRLILVLRETNVESGSAESLTPTLIERFLFFFYFGNDALKWISEVQSDCLKGRRGIAQVLKMAARHCASLTKVSSTRQHLKGSFL